MKINDSLFFIAALFFGTACSEGRVPEDAPGPESQPEPGVTLTVTADNVTIDSAVGTFSKADGILLTAEEGSFGMHFDAGAEVTATLENAPWLTVVRTVRTASTQFRFTVADAPPGGEAGHIVLGLEGATAVRVAVMPPPVPTPDPIPDPAPDPTPDPFDLSYELALELNTVDNLFEGYNRFNGAYYYPTRIEVYNAYPSLWGDRTAKTTSTAAYGFLTDAPKSFNHLSVPAFGDEALVFRGYDGKSSSQYNSGGITIVNARFSIGFFRQIRFTLPIPAGVLPTQRVVYKIAVNNITDNAVHDAPQISYEVVEREK